MRILVILLMLTFSAAASADREYWISVASFESYDRAEAALQALGDQISQRVSVVPDDNHIRYRVAVGPFGVRESAEDTLDQIRSSGIKDAWILTSQTTFFDAESAARFEGLQPERQYDRALDEERSESLGFGSSVNQSRNDTVPAAPAEPPPGYQLNKLRRTH